MAPALPRGGKLFRGVRNVLALLGLVVVLVTFTPVTRWYGQRLAGPWCDTGGQVLIVLGGSSIGLDVVARDTY
ncbi:MAG: hypothetical protein DMG57_16965 [Acidobacteria bacterium]|nr:MAG: hypothetical protein DMG57_16965 [Acidobacteriota bacterium]